MKKIIFLFLAALYSCAPAIYITGSRSETRPYADNIKCIFVAALTGDVELKSAFEKDLAAEFKKHGYSVTKSLDEFPAGFLKDSTDKQKLLDKLKGKKPDAILTISIIRRENDLRYIPDSWTYDPMMDMHPCILSPRYYINDVNYSIRSNLYNGKSGELMWSAQSKTYNIPSIFGITEQFAKEVVSRMISDSVLRQNSAAVIARNEQAKN